MQTIFDKEKEYWSQKNNVPKSIEVELNQYKNKNLKLLDLGCGAGRLVNYYCNFFENCCGVDNSYELIKESKNKNKKSFFVFGDFQKKDTWKDFDKFDLIISNCSIRKDYCSNLKSIFDLCYDYLNNNGKIIFRIQSFKDMENLLSSDLRKNKFYKKEDINHNKFNFLFKKEQYIQNFSSYEYVSLFLNRINIPNIKCKKTKIKREYILIIGSKK